jgi:DNA polymerase III subunit alpha
MPKPKVDVVEPFSEIEKLNLEKEVVGIYISGHPLDNFKFELKAFCNVTCGQLSEIEPLLGRELKLAGIVSAVEHRTTKTGKPFGKLTIEDYSGNTSFMLFGDDYIKFRNFMNIGGFLFIEGNVIKNTWGQQNIEFKIRNIELLHEIGVKRSKGIQVRVNIADITQDLIGAIEDVCQEFNGNAPLYIKFRDETQNINSDRLLSRRFRVNPVNEMASKLEKAGLEVSVVL